MDKNPFSNSPIPDNQEVYPDRLRKQKGRKKHSGSVKKHKFQKITFSISEKDFRKYSRLSLYEGIGFRQLIKKALKEYYSNTDMNQWEETLDNQLDLFDPVDLFGEPIRKPLPSGKKSGKTEKEKNK